MPVVAADTTLSRLRCFGQRTATRAIIKGDLVAVLTRKVISSDFLSSHAESFWNESGFNRDSLR
jgi:hypothetical protein